MMSASTQISPTRISYGGLPSMVPAYARVLLGRKPYIAPPGTTIEPVELEARRVTLSAAHLQRYRDVCAVPAGVGLPPAYLHLVAMPMHMQLFIVKNFPVKVLGLIHLRNTIRVLHPVDQRAPLRLTVYFDTMRLTDHGQEYDFVTRYEQNGAVVWEEVSTMFARGNAPPKEGGKRPSIERANLPASGVATETLEVADKTGWRYARVSGDFNPIHLTERTAQMFGFKQVVAHGMWSLGRCLAAAAAHLPTGRMQIDTQFKLPVYIPSQALARTWNSSDTVEIAMCTMRGDRLHLAMQVRAL
jgi:acyl dehydratase